MKKVPDIRIQDANKNPVNSYGEYVLYWMIGFRRIQWNFALDRAIEWAIELSKPLVIFEPIRIGYRWASDRFHQFVIDGMIDTTQKIENLKLSGIKGIEYYPYIEPIKGKNNGLLLEWSKKACLIVTDDCPVFFLHHLVSATAHQVPIKMEKIDSNGMLPLRATDKVFPTAFSFRAFLQKELPKHLDALPKEDPLAKVKLPELKKLPALITKNWPSANNIFLSKGSFDLTKMVIDHSVPIVNLKGGSQAGKTKLNNFLKHQITQYLESGNDPDSDSRSGLSPYLHFGHISSHQLFKEVMKLEKWSTENLSQKTNGKKEGWWGVSAYSEAWIDEFITWRELGYNMAYYRIDYDEYDSLPDWAQKTLEKHAKDKRPNLYSFEDFDKAKTHDNLWNAAQNQLVTEGRIHNYLRMLWGKKILEWSASPKEALATMIELNNRYALDGRDPNSISGIFWCLGRYDRPWGPERPIFGLIRYMSSDNTQRKLHVKKYLKLYTPNNS